MSLLKHKKPLSDPDCGIPYRRVVIHRLRVQQCGKTQRLIVSSDLTKAKLILSVEILEARLQAVLHHCIICANALHHSGIAQHNRTENRIGVKERKEERMRAHRFASMSALFEISNSTLRG